MTNIELISLIASIASLVLAIIAIWLSIVFYRLSSELAEKSNDAAKRINTSVEKLEKLFEKLYQGTFSMMKETVSDMRKHIWPDEAPKEIKINAEIEKRADEKIKIVKKDMESELQSILHQQKGTDDRLSKISKDLELLMSRVITDSRNIELEARRETVRDTLIKVIASLAFKLHRQPTLEEIMEAMYSVFPVGEVYRELENMVSENILSIYGDTMTGNPTIALVNP